MTTVIDNDMLASILADVRPLIGQGKVADYIPALAQAALADVCTGGNPREASLADIVELYQAAW